MHTPDQPFEAESSDDSGEIAKLEAELNRLKKKGQQKKKARGVYDSLLRRYSKQENLPSRPCGDLRPQRYSSTPNASLKSIPIAAFIRLTKYLTKTEIEDISASEKQLKAAVEFLSQEKDFPSHWYSCYTTWRNSSSKYADDFFLEATEAIKAAHNIQEPPNIIESRSRKRRRIERMETNRPGVPSCSPSHVSRGSDNREASSDDDNGSRPANSGSIDTLGVHVSRDNPKQNCQSDAVASNTEPTVTTAPATTPSPVKYTLAYVYKAEMANFFASLFIERLQGTAAWGMDRTTSCIRAHALEDAVEFEIDWGHPTAPSARDVFRQDAWGEVTIKQVTQLTIRVPFNKGQDVIQRLCYPSIITQ